MTKSERFRIEKLGEWSYFILFSGFALGLLLLSQLVESDTHDAYNFLMQARRLTDPKFASLAFEPLRPRALVFLLTIFDRAYLWCVHRYPSINEIHFLMAAISVGFVAVWERVFSRLLNPQIGRLAASLLIALPMLYWFGFRVLSDILGGFFWGTTVYLTLPLSGTRVQIERWALLGVSGAFLALSKHQLFILFPVWLAALFFLPIFEKRQRYWGAILATLVFFVSMELILRVTVAPHFGVLANLHEMIELNKWGRTAAALVRPPLFYTKEFFRFYGVWLVGGVGLAALCCLTQVKVFWTERPRTPRFHLALLFFAVTLAFLKLISDFPGKDTRWFFPFIPGACALAATLVYYGWRNFPSLLRIPASLLLVCGLFHPLKASYLQGNTLFNEARATNRDRRELWAFLSDGGCKEIEACWFQIFGIYYDEPQYFYQTGIWPKVARCEDLDLAKRRSHFVRSAREGQCTVLPANDPALEFPTPVAVLKKRASTQWDEGIFFKSLNPAREAPGLALFPSRDPNKPSDTEHRTGEHTSQHRPGGDVPLRIQPTS